MSNKNQEVEDLYSFSENNSKEVWNKLGEHIGFWKIPIDKAAFLSGITKSKL